ncbi:MAG: hypothetical protein J7521_19920 [Caulobacter sp.]|nr:hypothetical protein [Caulobacter sp.]
MSGGGKHEAHLPLVHAFLAVVLSAVPLIGGGARAEDKTVQVAGFELDPSMNTQAALFVQKNSWFGESQANLGRKSGTWFEAAVEPTLGWTRRLPGGGELFGSLSVIGALSKGVDAGGSNVEDSSVTDVDFEDAFIGWRSSAKAGGGSDDPAVTLQAGRLRYAIGTGFLFWAESGNGGSRAAAWIGPRQNARYAAQATFRHRDYTLNLVALKLDDKPSSHTRLAGLDLAYDRPWGQLGAGYYQILDSDIPTRDDMNIYDVRASLHDLPHLGGLRLAGEYVHQHNGRTLKSDAAYGEIGWAFETTPWKPVVSYRQSIYKGDDVATDRDEAYDPLALGLSSWGTWYRGEIVGEYVLSNSNLKAHTVSLAAQPSKKLTLTALHYLTSLDHLTAGTTSREFAREFNLIADYEWRADTTFSAVLAVARPRNGARQETGGDKDWLYAMFYVNKRF